MFVLQDFYLKLEYKDKYS